MGNKSHFMEKVHLVILLFHLWIVESVKHTCQSQMGGAYHLIGYPVHQWKVYQIQKNLPDLDLSCFLHPEAKEAVTAHFS